MNNILFLIIGILLAAVIGTGLYLVPRVVEHEKAIQQTNQNITAIVAWLQNAASSTPR